jgi:hypothetical protein
MQLGSNRLQGNTPVNLGQADSRGEYWNTRTDWDNKRDGGTLRNLLWRIRGDDQSAGRPQSPRFDLTDPKHIQQLLNFSGSSYNQRWLKWARENAGVSIHDPSSPFPGYAPSGMTEEYLTPEAEKWYQENPGGNYLQNPFIGQSQRVSSNIKTYRSLRTAQTHADGLALLGLLQRLKPNSELQGATREKVLGAFLQRVRGHSSYQRRFPATGGAMLKKLTFNRDRPLD